MWISAGRATGVWQLDPFEEIEDPIAGLAPLQAKVRSNGFLDLPANTGVTVEDIAKRLIDYGFHAPTMSFPVAGTLMVEPTESESLVEIDRFCDAMIAIHDEAMRVREGVWPSDDNPLVNAPHPADDVIADDWPHAYSRQVAAHPQAFDRANKYWPPVSRIDGVAGDRNLVCTCPPLDTLAQARA